MSRLDRITTEESVCHGKPVIRGLRYPVQMLLELLASGMSIEEVLADYPDLERDDLLAALEFAALTAGKPLRTARSAHPAAQQRSLCCTTPGLVRRMTSGLAR